MDEFRWRKKVRQEWEVTLPVSEELQLYFDAGRVDMVKSYGEWLRQPYLLDDGDVDRALLEQTPPEAAQLVLGKVAFEMACICDGAYPTNEQIVDDFMFLYSMNDPLVEEHCRTHCSALTGGQRRLIHDLISRLLDSEDLRSAYPTARQALRCFGDPQEPAGP